MMRDQELMLRCVPSNLDAVTRSQGYRLRGSCACRHDTRTLRARLALSTRPANDISTLYLEGPPRFRLLDVEVNDTMSHVSTELYRMCALFLLPNF